MNRDLLSRREAAELAGVHTNTVIAWERNGLIEVRRVRVKGKQETRIDRSEIERMIGTTRRERPARTRERVTPEPQARDSRIARRLRRLREREPETVTADAIDERGGRRERQASARALRRERDALEQAKADRAAREATERGAAEARRELTEARDVVARQR